jgi:hypothetical protein
LKQFAQNSIDPARTEIFEVAENPLIPEIAGLRAVIQSGTIPLLFDVLIV